MLNAIFWMQTETGRVNFGGIRVRGSHSSPNLGPDFYGESITKSSGINRQDTTWICVCDLSTLSMGSHFRTTVQAKQEALLSSAWGIDLQHLVYSS
jgi:hypothetical protein